MVSKALNQPVMGASHSEIQEQELVSFLSETDHTAEKGPLLKTNTV